MLLSFNHILLCHTLLLSFNPLLYAVRHAKPRLSLFSSDELTVHIEDRLVFQENVRFPAATSTPEVKFSFGTNLDGQMAPIYLFSESLPAPAGMSYVF
jgi:hypothetical protein